MSDPQRQERPGRMLGWSVMLFMIGVVVSLVISPTNPVWWLLALVTLASGVVVVVAVISSRSRSW